MQPRHGGTKGLTNSRVCFSSSIKSSFLYIVRSDYIALKVSKRTSAPQIPAPCPGVSCQVSDSGRMASIRCAMAPSWLANAIAPLPAFSPHLPRHTDTKHTDTYTHANRRGAKKKQAKKVGRRVGSFKNERY